MIARSTSPAIIKPHFWAGLAREVDKQVTARIMGKNGEGGGGSRRRRPRDGSRSEERGEEGRDEAEEVEEEEELLRMCGRRRFRLKVT